MQMSGRQIVQEGKDEFFARIIDEMVDCQERERAMFKDTKEPRVMDASLADFYTMLIARKQDATVRDILKTQKLPEKYHFMMVIRAMAKAG
jgi:hypothetical protein